MSTLPGLSDDELDHHDPAFVADPWPNYQHLRRGRPVSHSNRYGGFWLITRYDDVVAGTLLIPSGMQRSFAFLPLEYDPPEHTVYRQLVAPVFSPRRVNALTGEIRGLAEQLLDPLLAAGGGDLATAFAAPLTSGALALFIGLPDEDKSLWVDLVRRSFEGSVRDHEDAARAGAEFRDYIDGLIAARRENRSDDLISLLLDSEVEGRTLTEDQIRGFTMLVLVAGHETTAAALSYSLWHLARHPADLERLREDRALVPSAVEEFLRLSSPSASSRATRRRTRSSRAARCPPGRSSACPSPRRTATRTASTPRRPVGSTAAPTGTWPSAPASTSASAPRWPVESCRSPSRSCWTAGGRSRWTGRRAGRGGATPSPWPASRSGSTESSAGRPTSRSCTPPARRGGASSHAADRGSSMNSTVDPSGSRT